MTFSFPIGIAIAYLEHTRANSQRQMSLDNDYVHVVIDGCYPCLIKKNQFYQISYTQLIDYTDKQLGNTALTTPPTGNIQLKKIHRLFNLKLLTVAV